MLQHAIGEYLVEAPIAKWQISAVGNNIRSSDSQLPSHTIRGANALQRGINTNRSVPRARGRYAPSAPIAANFEKALVPARRQPKMRNRVFGQLPHQVLIEAPVGRTNRVLHEWINLMCSNVELSQRGSIARLGDSERPSTLDMGLFHVRDQQNGNSLDDSVAMSLTANEAACIQSQIALVARTHQYSKVGLQRANPAFVLGTRKYHRLCSTTDSRICEFGRLEHIPTVIRGVR